MRDGDWLHQKDILTVHSDKKLVPGQSPGEPHKSEIERKIESLKEEEKEDYFKLEINEDWCSCSATAEWNEARSRQAVFGESWPKNFVLYVINSGVWKKGSLTKGYCVYIINSQSCLITFLIHYCCFLHKCLWGLLLRKEINKDQATNKQTTTKPYKTKKNKNKQKSRKTTPNKQEQNKQTKERKNKNHNKNSQPL